MTSKAPRSCAPVARCCTKTATNIGDIQVRNRGTIGGSIAHADPAADYPASLLALEARVVLVSAKSEREMPIADFFVDTFTTALEPGELVREVIVPWKIRPPEPAIRKWSSRRPASPSSASPRASAKAGGRVTFARIGVTGLAGKPYRAINVEKALEGTAGSPSDIQKAAALVADGVEANSDLHASANYRKHLATRLHNARAGYCIFEDGLKISGSYSVPANRERTYQLLQDPAVLAKCMPGTDHLDKIADDEYEMKMKMAIASIGGLFTGKVRLADQNPPESFRLMVEGTGKIGFLKGEGLLNLTPQAESTEVKYEGDVQVGGTIASVGQRLLDTTSKMIIKKFFEKLSEAAVE